MANGTPDSHNAGFENSAPDRQGLEIAARAALHSLAGRTLTDAEWTRARARLLKWITILWHWSRRAEEFSAHKVVKIPEDATSESVLDKAA